MRYLLALIALCSSSVFGAVLFSDNFDSSLGSTVLNADVPGWDETDGTVDYLKDGFLGVRCRGNSGGCIDLDGSTGNSAVFSTSASFILSAGATYLLSFYLSGNQRSGDDSVTASFAGESVTAMLASNAPFTLYTIMVTPAAAMNSVISLENLSNDNIGLVLDDVTLERVEAGAVPEPSTCAMLATGLAALVLKARRR